MPISRRLVPALLMILLALPGVCLIPAGAQPAAETNGEWELLKDLHIVRLENGMTFLIHPNRRAPIFSGVIRFDVGGKDELPGQTGIAHLFEHMAFKGTPLVGTTDWQAEQAALRKVEAAARDFDRERERLIAAGATPEEMQERLADLRARLEEAQREAAQYVVKDEFDQIYQREGATDINATTSPDATTYFLSLPANRIDLWARMESDRLTSPVMREFYSERDVVMEERRMRMDNQPVGRLWELTMATAFIAHPYQVPTIGWESDIRNLTADGAMEFFRTHYTPDRAVGALVGDLDIEETERILRETFGRIPAADPDRPAPRVVPEPEQEGERRAILELDAQPTLLMAWHKPTIPHVADVQAEALMEVLTGGRSARWFEKLVKERRLAADVSTFTGPGDAHPNLFIVYAVPQEGVTLEELEAALREEVATLRSELVDAAELEAAKKRLRANAIRALNSNLGLAQQLASMTQISGDPYYLERRLRQLEAVTPEELRDFARTHLIDRNLTVGMLKRPTPSEPLPGEQ